jgi:hypothetical protein
MACLEEDTMSTYGNPVTWTPAEIDVDGTAHEVKRVVDQVYRGVGASVGMGSQFYYSASGDPGKLIEVVEGRLSAVQIYVQRNLRARGGRKYKVSLKILGRVAGVEGLVTQSEREFNARDTGEILEKIGAVK